MSGNIASLSANSDQDQDSYSPSQTSPWVYTDPMMMTLTSVKCSRAHDYKKEVKSLGTHIKLATTDEAHLEPHIYRRMAPSVLIVGLPFENPTIPEDVKVTIRTSIEKLNTNMIAAGYNYKTLLTGPDGFEPTSDSTVSIIVDTLQKTKWDVVVIGFGVRAKPELTLFFERLVNAIREHAPQAKMGFSTLPEEALDAAKRLAPM